MPTVNPQTFGSRPNLADSRAPFQPAFDDQSRPTIENAPVFVAAEYTDTETSPPSRNLRSEPYFASKPRLPNRPMRPIEPATNFATRPTIPRSNAIQAPEMPFENSKPIANNPFGRRYDHNGDHQQSRSNGLMPIPRIQQPLTITDPGGAFGNRDPQLEWRHTAKATVVDNTSEYLSLIHI